MSLYGKAVSPGIAIGKVYIYSPFVPQVNKAQISKDEVEGLLQRYASAQKAAAAELEALVEHMQKGSPEKAKIFTAHLDILYDEAIDEEVRTLVTEGLLSPDHAADIVFGKYEEALAMTGDAILCERAADLRDVRNRLLRCFAGLPERSLAVLAAPSVVVAEDLLPSDTATLDQSKVLAILTQVGGSTSHSAILARSYGIPAILGIPKLLENLTEGEEVVVDAVEGKVYPSPDADTLRTYEGRREQFAAAAAETGRYIDKEPVTKDGVRLELHLNVGSADAKELENAPYTDGVGLFRTEFLYMGRDRLPTEEEQLAVYRKVLLSFAGRPVTLRTLDIGGDKKLPYLQLPVEENPFLGLRGLRLSFTMPEVFRTQLRAALRAACYGELWLMLPMVESLEDIRRAKALLKEVKGELASQHIPFGDCKLGIMVEIPSIALIADQAAKEVDFASIGSNDLTQYCTAVDRQSPTLSLYDQPYHPALFRLIGYVVRSFEKADRPVCICGELGSDPLAIPVLMGLGLRKLSVGPSAVARSKKLLSGLTIEAAQRLAKAVMDLPTAGDVERYLRKELAPLLG